MSEHHDENTPRLWMLVGPPASGKSTWRNTMMPIFSNAVVVSTDDLIEAHATKNGMTYSEAFRAIDFKIIDKAAEQTFVEAVKARQDIIVDRTNMTAKSRARFLDKAIGYRTIAVVFNVDREVIDQRLAVRAETTGKIIPKFVVDGMIKNYEPPAPSEFDDVSIGNREASVEAAE